MRAATRRSGLDTRLLRTSARPDAPPPRGTQGDAVGEDQALAGDLDDHGIPLVGVPGRSGRRFVLGSGCWRFAGSEELFQQPGFAGPGGEDDVAGYLSAGVAQLSGGTRPGDTRRVVAQVVR